MVTFRSLSQTALRRSGRLHRSSVLQHAPSNSGRHSLRSQSRGLAQTTHAESLSNPAAGRDTHTRRDQRPSLPSAERSGCIHPDKAQKRFASQNKTDTFSQEPRIHSVFEKTTGTWQYIVSDPSTNAAVIIDPVLNYDPCTQDVNTKSADELIALAKERDYRIEWILETHAHADHLSAASYLQTRLAQQQSHRPPIGIGKRIGRVQEMFGKRYAVAGHEYKTVFDKLFDDDENFEIGNLSARAIHLPGHTPDHLGYKIGDNVFCGDSIFHADIGTARCDFPGGSPTQLFQSARKLLQLPDHVKIWTGHDYPPDGRDPVAWMTVKDHKEQNKHLNADIDEERFVAMRKERDAALAAPRLLHQSLQINIRAGNLPKPTESGHRLLHLPLRLKGVEW